MKRVAWWAALVLIVTGGAHAQHAGHGGHPQPPAPPPPAPPARAAPSVPALSTPAPRNGQTAAVREEPRVPIDVPAVQQDRIGLQTAKLAVRRVTPTLRTVAIVQVDERREAHVHTKVPGWLDDVEVNEVGQPVKKGQVLYRIYSPEIVSTQQEFISAREQGGEIGKKVSKAALQRLRLWGVSPRDIASLERTGTMKRALAIESPADGVVLDKLAAQGIYATPDLHLYRIADLSKVWVVASLYETEVALVKEGDPVEILLPSEPGTVRKSEVSYVYPEIDLATRAGRARMEIDNPDGALKPGMYATVTLQKNLGDVVIAPADSVIDTGMRRLVFVKVGETRFEPRAVVLGPRVEDGFVVVSGVSSGEDVVVRASFLIDAESRLQAALEAGGGPQGHAGHGG